MTETLLTLGAISVMSVAIYAVLKPTDASAQVKIEQDNMRDLSRSIDRSFGLLGSFSTVSTNRVINDNLAPSRMLSGGDMTSSWGSRISVNPFSVSRPNDAFVVTYPQAPGGVCAQLASAMGRDAHHILINGNNVYSGGELNPGRAASECATGEATMEFVFHSGLVSGQAVAADPVVLPPNTPTLTPPPSDPPPSLVIPDAPDVAPVDPGAPAVPPPSAPPPVNPPPVAPPPSAPPPVVAPPTLDPLTPPDVVSPGVMCAARPSQPEIQHRIPNCASGQWGVREQRRERMRTWSCPEAWAQDVENLPRAPWPAWSDTTNTCVTCPTLPNENETRWVDTVGECPAGFEGELRWQREQIRTRTQSYNCPAGTTTLPPISDGSWSQWANTGATRNPVDGCTPIVHEPCPEPQVETEVRNYNMCGGQPGSEFLWGGDVQAEFVRTREATCDGGDVTWSAWSAFSVRVPVLGGCLCEVRPSGPMGPAWPMANGGWGVEQQGGGMIYYECR